MQYHPVMMDQFRQKIEAFPELQRVLVIGIGSGALCTYLHQTFPQLRIDGVDIDSAVVDLAKNFFGFTPNDNLKSHIADGLSFVRNSADSGTKQIVSLWRFSLCSKVPLK